ncbi:hypothetical protein [Chryseobacterium echinoideorum]|uniref:hypothetical protein n=1 Tax=Chryseobacterium echinoideorum TaxID=1549648 RepID=UPI00118559E0|nr:hypothetical protein [Chryseobacterium echinoideorum]
MIKIDLRNDCQELRNEFPHSQFTDLFSNYLIGVTKDNEATYDGEKIMDNLMKKHTFNSNNEFIEKYLELESRLENYFKHITDVNIKAPRLVYISDYSCQALTIDKTETLELSS